MSGVIDDERLQTLTDHLSELRDRLIKSAYAIVATSILAWNFSEPILEWIERPVKAFIPGGKLVYLGPTDAFMAHIKIAITAGIVLACPVWLYQVWRFVAPGLYAKERRYTAVFICSGTSLFVIGVLFAYYLVLPTGLKFLLQFGSESSAPMITLPEYLSFFNTMILVFGASFELPLVLVILGVIGLIDQRFLREKRRYAIVLLAVLSAIITPPDVMSMLMLLVPMMALYEISILLVGITARKRVESNI